MSVHHDAPTTADACSEHPGCYIACGWCGNWRHEHPTSYCKSVGLDGSHVTWKQQELRKGATE